MILNASFPQFLFKNLQSGELEELVGFEQNKQKKICRVILILLAMHYCSTTYNTMYCQSFWYYFLTEIRKVSRLLL